LKIIPVLDIQNGVAVHAVRGMRKEYKPLKSVLCATADPVEVAKAFKMIGFSELYVADLDAISGMHPNFDIIRKIANMTGLRLMVDAGVADLNRAEELLQSHVSKIIVGTETLSTVSFVKEAIDSFGRERVIVSLDMKNGEVLTGFDSDKRMKPLEILLEFQRMGLTQVIFLDLAKVGSSEGFNVPFLKEALRRFDLRAFVGGGVRDVADLVELKNIGVSGVLLATALHSGRINEEKAKQAGLSFS
jgi:phosphoribosylformimino-5-aminoimidazole carboxamide ribotide isomerase